MNTESKFEELLGKTIIKIKGEVGSDSMIFTVDNGDRYELYHEQDCCEIVSIEDICGDLADLIGSPLLLAEEVISVKNPEGIEIELQDSFTWTFYKLATNKGAVTIRWYGESNGYYSESVEFRQL